MNTVSGLDALQSTVLDLMDKANARRIVPDPRAMRYQQRGDECIAVEDTETESSTAVFRHSEVTEAVQKRLEKDWYYGPSYVQKFRAICKNRGSKRGFAYRPLIRVSREYITDSESGLEKPFDITYYDEARYINYDDIWEKIERFGCGLRELGLRVDSKVCIYLETRWEWLVSSYGIWSQSMTLVTVYANLGVDALIEAFTETACGAIITTLDNVSLILKLMADGTIPRSVIIYLDGKLSGVDTTGFKVLAWEDVIKTGALSAYEPTICTNNDDLALIMYTSGTTGGPKGVMHTYGSITAGINGMGERLNDIVGPLERDETYVAALPLAHIFEFAVSNIFIARGSLICFGHPRTLLSTFARPRGDYEEYRPCLLIGVPRIFDTIKKTVESLLAPRDSLERKIFDHAFASKLKSIRQGMSTPFWDEVVFAPFSKLTGGRVRGAFCGGGPMSAPTQTFMNVAVAFGCIQGWGLTETIGNGTKQLVGDIETNCVGPCERACEMKLIDTEDYKHTDLPEPRGEICLRSPCMFKGYYKKPETTKEVLSDDGWFRTGDIGAIAPRGRLRVISRIKSLAKNSLGEYVPMEVMECVYAQNRLSVPNGVCVLVHPHKNFICAIACTNESKAMNFAQEHRIEGEYPAILKKPEFQKLATESFQESALTAGRGTHEVLRYVRVVDDVWTPENNVLTAAGKLKRRVINEKYQALIEGLFAE